MRVLSVMTRLALCVLLAAIIAPSVSALDNGLGSKPPMGWSSWYCFFCDPLLMNETNIRETALAMKQSGLSDAGYQYVLLDDCWAEMTRDSKGTLQAQKATFPSGIAALAEYVHSLDLLIGIYSDAGNLTCGGRPASLGHEVDDARTFVNWGIDYLKYDNCYDQGIDPKVRYPPMRDALNSTGQRVWFELCEWGVEEPSEWARSVGNSWRTTGDIGAPVWANLLSNLDENDAAWKGAGPGGWNDPDNLQVGNDVGGAVLTLDEQIAQMSLWCIMKAPLLLGNDVRNMTKDTLRILTNPEAIAINQDWLGVQGHRVASTAGSGGSSLDVYAGPLGGGDVALVLFNRGATVQPITANFSDIGLSVGSTARVRNVWSRRAHADAVGSLTAVVNSHGAEFFRLTPLHSKMAAVAS